MKPLARLREIAAVRLVMEDALLVASDADVFELMFELDGLTEPDFAHRQTFAAEHPGRTRESVALADSAVWRVRWPRAGRWLTSARAGEVAVADDILLDLQRTVQTFMDATHIESATGADLDRLMLVTGALSPEDIRRRRFEGRDD